MRSCWLLGLVGCYAPTAAPGSPCLDGRCPTGLACEYGVCVVPGTGVAPDGPTTDTATTDAAIDAMTPIDAPIDGPSSDLTLVGHWKFDDDPTDGALDSSGRGHTGTCVACPTLVVGKLGGAYRFDAALDQLIRVPDHLDFRGVFTIAAWVSADVTPDQIAIMSKPQGTGSGNSWQLELLANDRISFSGGSTHALEGGPTFAPQTWYHVAGTWDGTTKRLYIDGVLVASVASAITYDTHSVYLGGDENGGTQVLHWDGVLDELRVYNRVLTAQELLALAE